MFYPPPPHPSLKRENMTAQNLNSPERSTRPRVARRGGGSGGTAWWTGGAALPAPPLYTRITMNDT